MPTVYRILSRADWEAARVLGEFRGSAHDVRDGFIHFSSADQVAETARIHYASLPDLVLLYVRTEALAPDAWRWEPARSRNDQLFPHLYGVLPTAAVHRVETVILESDGTHRFAALEH
jgi:uncharacterized protein (DUF952 family)